MSNPTTGHDLIVLNKQLSRAKIRVMETPNTAFIGSIAFQLEHKFNYKVPTAATDATFVHYNPDFWSLQSPKQQLGLLLHETWHVALDHCGAITGGRGLNVHHGRWNAAADFVINIMLSDAGIELPDGGLLDPQYRNMATEEVYALLKDEDYPDVNDLRPGQGDDDKAAKEALDDMISQAAVASELAGQGIGNLPGEIQIHLKGLREPKIDWRSLLRRYLYAIIKENLNFKKPNRRFFPDFHLPTRHSEGLGNVGFVMDMSGSVSDSEIDQFLSDAKNVLWNLRPKKMTLVQFSHVLVSVDEIRSAEEADAIDFSGRGGTNIEPPLEWAKENKPDVLVIFTDGEFSTPRCDPGVPVIWLIHNGPQFKAPFGQVVHYVI